MQLWEKEIDLQVPDNLLGVSELAVDKAGNSTLLAPSYDAERPLARLFRYTPDGEKLWEREIENLGFASLAVSENAIYLSGTSVLETNPAPRIQKWLIDGTQAWERTYEDFYVLILTRIIHTQDDNLYLVTGSDILDSEQDNYGTVEIAKLDNSGTVLWRDTLEPTPHWTFETAISDHKGRLYVVGGADDQVESGELYSYVSRYSADGKRDWTYRLASSRSTSIFRGGGLPDALAVAQAPGETEPLTRVYMGGSNGGDDAFVFAADDVTGDENYTADVPDLNPRWIKH